MAVTYAAFDIVVRPPYLNNGAPRTGKVVYWYWNDPVFINIFHQHWADHKEPWVMCVNESHGSIENLDMVTAKQCTTTLYLYLMGYIMYDQAPFCLHELT